MILAQGFLGGSYCWVSEREGGRQREKQRGRMRLKKSRDREVRREGERGTGTKEGRKEWAIECGGVGE